MLSFFLISLLFAFAFFYYSKDSSFDIPTSLKFGIPIVLGTIIGYLFTMLISYIVLLETHNRSYVDTKEEITVPEEIKLKSEGIHILGIGGTQPYKYYEFYMKKDSGKYIPKKVHLSDKVEIRTLCDTCQKPTYVKHVAGPKNNNSLFYFSLNPTEKIVFRLPEEKIQ